MEKDRSLAPWWIFIAAWLLQLPLILNPGYYSHDELQWAYFADIGMGVSWLDPTTFQYRPLTFNLWMALSRALFDTPTLFHGVLVAWGSLNATLLYKVGRGFGMDARLAAFGALAFVVSPYATYTHGWVGCIADLVWVSCALLIALCVLHGGKAWSSAAAGALFTAAGLLAKEAALAIPALLLVAWLFDGRKPRWLAAALGAGVAAAPYLGFRLDTLLHAPREGAQYAIDPLNAPLRWLEYQVFPPIVPLLETFTTLQRIVPAVIAGVLWLGLLAALWQASRRLVALFLLGGAAALSPVLPMAGSFNHYAYGFAALASMVIAAAWPRASRSGRIAISVFAILTVLHGGFVMWRMQQVGRIQSVFSPALAQAVRDAGDGHRVSLRIDPQAKEWVFRRLTHAIPRYDGVDIGDRVRLANAGEAADFLVRPDGSLQALPRGR